MKGLTALELSTLRRVGELAPHEATPEAQLINTLSQRVLDYDEWLWVMLSAAFSLGLALAGLVGGAAWLALRG